MCIVVVVSLAQTTFGGGADNERVVAIDSQTRAKYKLAPFYGKILVAEGLIFASSNEVADAALTEASQIVAAMLADKPAARQAMADVGVRVVVMAPTEMTTEIPEHAHLKPRDYWDRRARGLGWSPEAPIVSCGEENLLAYPGDPYIAESILIHEFAHAVQSVAMARLTPNFEDRLNAAYEAAIDGKLWEKTYAATNPLEYWAEGTQTWFHANAGEGPVHNAIDTRAEIKAYDPRLSKLLEEAYGDRPWRYEPPNRRSPPPIDYEKSPTFTWPTRLVNPQLEAVTPAHGRKYYRHAETENNIAKQKPPTP
jgi:hypothetical protein